MDGTGAKGLWVKGMKDCRTCGVGVWLGGRSQESTARRFGSGLHCRRAAAGSRRRPRRSPPRPIYRDAWKGRSNIWIEETSGRVLMHVCRCGDHAMCVCVSGRETHPWVASTTPDPCSWPRLRLLAYVDDGQQSGVAGHMPCTLRAASTSSCSLLLGTEW